MWNKSVTNNEKLWSFFFFRWENKETLFLWKSCTSNRKNTHTKRNKNNREDQSEATLPQLLQAFECDDAWRKTKRCHYMGIWQKATKGQPASWLADCGDAWPQNANTTKTNITTIITRYVQYPIIYCLLLLMLAVVVFVVISQFNVSFRQCWHNFICEYRWRGTPLLAGARVAPSVVACGGCRGCRSINFDVCFLYCKNFSAEITEIKNGMTLRCADPRLHRPRRYLPHL